MNEITLGYIEWLDENFQYLDYLNKEIKHWEKVYQKRVYQEGWPDSIKDILNNLMKEVEVNLKECQYYLKRYKELKEAYDKAHQAQFEQDQRNAGETGAIAGDTDKNLAGAQPENLGSAS